MDVCCTLYINRMLRLPHPCGRHVHKCSSTSQYNINFLRGSFIFQSPTVEFWPFFFLLNSCTNTFGPLFLTLAVIFQGKGQGQCLLGLCGGRKRGGGIESLAWGIHLSTSVTRNKMSFVTGCFILSQTAEIQRIVQNEILGNVQTKNRKKMFSCDIQMFSCNTGKKQAVI